MNPTIRSIGRINIGDAELACEVSGSGPVVVLIHAGIADMHMWDLQVSALATRFRVVRYDPARLRRVIRRHR
ncbi:MAG: hypothetical protein M9890_08195 [Thermomicrobiales bacterium]|nr:hypothetical protein [Thermomicrobiales bacterium]